MLLMYIIKIMVKKIMKLDTAKSNLKWEYLYIGHIIINCFRKVNKMHQDIIINKNNNKMAKEIAGAGKLAQWSRVLAVLVKDPSSVPGTHMSAHNHF